MEKVDKLLVSLTRSQLPHSEIRVGMKIRIGDMSDYLVVRRKVLRNCILVTLAPTDTIGPPETEERAILPHHLIWDVSNG